jgi:hypothetical protein
MARITKTMRHEAARLALNLTEGSDTRELLRRIALLPQVEVIDKNEWEKLVHDAQFEIEDLEENREEDETRGA